jgi:hypothetical protein
MAKQPFSPVVVKHREKKRSGDLTRLLPAALGSAIFHCLLFGLLFLLSSPTKADAPVENTAEVIIQPDPPDDGKVSDPLVTNEIDPSGKTPQQNQNYDVPRLAPISIPGIDRPLDAVGIGEGKDLPTSIPLPLGGSRPGPGGTIESFLGQDTIKSDRDPGGSLTGRPLIPGGWGGRGSGTRERLELSGGGTLGSHAAVVEGLLWLKRNQTSDGRWLLDGNFKDRGTANDVAGTAFGLLPLLGAGKTHKKAKDNEFDKPIEKALLYLIRKQDRRSGYFGGGMYAHGLATIAMCEAYGLTQDPALRRPAQMAINFIVRAQHSAGGWRYSPGQAGDTSVVGWQVMALKSAQMAGLDVPDITMRKAQQFLNKVCDPANEGYGYLGPGSTPAMSAVGLLCRQYLQAWGPQNLRLIKGIENNIQRYPPGTLREMYYYYYATQVMHHFGGHAWTKWNNKMRDSLVKSQDKSSSPNRGSWSSVGDRHSEAGGRLMQTSLALLTLEVYYRHLPLYYRETGVKNTAAK